MHTASDDGSGRGTSVSFTTLAKLPIFPVDTAPGTKVPTFISLSLADLGEIIREMLEALGGVIDLEADEI